MLPVISQKKMSMEIFKDTTDRKKKQMDHIHEEYYDADIKGKWTIFNKHAIEIEEPENEDDDQEYICQEDSIIEQMKMDDRCQHPHNVCTLP